MENLISSYETMFIVDCSKSEEETAALVAKFRALIETNGTVDKFEEWGKRKLAYPINDMTEGYYVLADYKAGMDFSQELSRVFNITEGIMRYLVIKL